MPCCAFSCVPHSAAAQPFAVTVAPAARLLMDLHAHLCSNEVIGFLGGTVDASTKCIRIERVSGLPGTRLDKHLCSNEVIGFLGGTVDASTKCIRIERVSGLPGTG